MKVENYSLLVLDEVLYKSHSGQELATEETKRLARLGTIIYEKCLLGVGFGLVLMEASFISIISG